MHLLFYLYRYGPELCIELGDETPYQIRNATERTPPLLIRAVMSVG